MTTGRRTRIWLLAAGLAAALCPGLRAGAGEPTVSAEESKRLQEIARLAQNSPQGAFDELKPLVGPETSPAMDYTLGTLALQLKLFPQARESFQKALDKKPDFARARSGLVRTLIETGQLSEAVAQLQPVLYNPAADPSSLTLLGYALLMKDQPAAAETAYRQALFQNPDDANACAGLARSLLAQGRFPEARSLLRELLDHNPQSGQLWELLANCSMASGRNDQAICELEAGRRLRVISVSALATLADLYLAADQPAEAVAAYREAFASGDPSIERMLHAAEGFIRLRDASNAKIFLDSAQRLCQDTTQPAERMRQFHWVRGQYLELADQVRPATEAYRAALGVDPLYGPAMMALGDLQRRQGAVEDARLWYERAARVPSTQVQALLRLGRLQAEEGEYAKALDTLEEARRIREDSVPERTLNQLRRLLEVSRRLVEQP